LKLENHNTGQVIYVNKKRLIDDVEYFKEKVVEISKIEVDNYLFAKEQLDGFKNVKERALLKS